MASVRTIELPWTTLVTATTSAPDDFFPLTGWMSAAEVQEVRVTFELRGETSDFRVIPAYQRAQVFDTPGDSYDIGTTTTTADGYEYPSQFEDVSSNLNGYDLVRFGFHALSGNGTSSGRVGGSVEVQTCD